MKELRKNENWESVPRVEKAWGILPKDKKVWKNEEVCQKMRKNLIS